MRLSAYEVCNGRIRRLFNTAVSYMTDVGNLRCSARPVHIHDDKGNLYVAWDSSPSKENIEWLTETWPDAELIHFVNKVPLHDHGFGDWDMPDDGPISMDIPDTIQEIIKRCER